MAFFRHFEFERFLFVSKMDTHPDVVTHESSAKRIKLDLGESNIGELCNDVGFSSFSTSDEGPIDGTEGLSADCDSGYEASTLEFPSHHASPIHHSDPDDLQETLSSLSGSYMQTPTHQMDQLETSQDSLEVDDDNASTVSHLSEISGISDLSGQDWKPMAGSMIWIQKQMQKGVNPRNLLSDMGVEPDQIPQYVEDLTIWKLIINMLAEPPRRNKLRHVNTLDDVVRLLKGAQNIIVLTGAGVSVSCGIPDFRSRDGIYSRLAVDFPNLPDPQAMFDISYFSQDPRPFFKFAKDIYPGKFKPSPCHRFIKLLEKHNKLLRNYTQNIDTLEKEADIKRVIECHGSFATATCTKCRHKVSAEKIRETVLPQKIPLCDLCQDRETSVSTDELSENRDFRELVSNGIMKPDIVFFGEGLPDTFHEAMSEDKLKCDLLLVIGSSLKVRPVALIPSSLPAHVPQILINREPLGQCNFDVELLGDCDVIINHLCRLLGDRWKEGIFSEQNLKETDLLPLPIEPDFQTNHRKPEMENLNECTCANDSSLDSETETNCKCFKMSINSTDSLDLKSKERHMSIDSARDSGIGDNSNFTDLEMKYEDTSDNSDNKDNPDRKDNSDNRETTHSFHMEISQNPSCSTTEVYSKESTSMTDLRGFWQPKVKRSMADRLPPDSYHLITPSRYIFPGAEVFYDPDESIERDDSLSSDSSDSESEDTDSPIISM